MKSFLIYKTIEYFFCTSAVVNTCVPHISVQLSSAPKNIVREYRAQPSLALSKARNTKKPQNCYSFLP